MWRGTVRGTLRYSLRITVRIPCSAGLGISQIIYHGTRIIRQYGTAVLSNISITARYHTHYIYIYICTCSKESCSYYLSILIRNFWFLFSLVFGWGRGSIPLGAGHHRSCNLLHYCDAFFCVSWTPPCRQLFFAPAPHLHQGVLQLLLLYILVCDSCHLISFRCAAWVRSTSGHHYSYTAVLIWEGE